MCLGCVCVPCVCEGVCCVCACHKYANLHKNNKSNNNYSYYGAMCAIATLGQVLREFKVASEAAPRCNRSGFKGKRVPGRARE